jgi:hypothetical protein
MQRFGMEMMKRYSIVILAAALLTSCGSDTDIQINTRTSAGFASYYGGNRYDFSFSQKDFSECPEWTLSDTSPPLGMKSAAEAARRRLGSVLKSEVDNWQLSAVEFNAFADGKQWVYRVRFMSPPEGEDMSSHSFEIPVLMSGKTVKPSVHDEDEWP